MDRLWERMIVLANRAPLRYELDSGGRARAARSASGLVTALEPAIKACGGTWVAYGGGTADRIVADAHHRVPVPPAAPQYRIRYVWLADDDYRGYYYGFANEALWPLCHDAGVQPVFRPADFAMYRAANASFAQAVADETEGRPALVLVQDYHFALAPRLVRRQLPRAAIVAFWHIPWPPLHVMRTCPWARELIRGLLGSDVVGLQTSGDCARFLACAASLLGAEVREREGTVTYRRRQTKIRAYPVGVEWGNAAVRTAAPAPACRERVYRDLQIPATARLGIGVDRLDYTKGIPEKLLAIERLLEVRPDLRGSLVFVQVAEPSRECLPAYRAVRAQVVDAAERINRRFGARDYRPVHLREHHHEAAAVYELYRAADFCYVGSLADGMNLVAKEFVCAREDGRGVLVLSRHAGAAQQLRAALIVDPRNTAHAAEAIGRALDMTEAEQARRMESLRVVVAEFDSGWWTERLLHDALPVEPRGTFGWRQTDQRRSGALQV